MEQVANLSIKLQIQYVIKIAYVLQNIFVIVYVN